jgi:hypothetical protein
MHFASGVPPGALPIPLPIQAAIGNLKKPTIAGIRYGPPGAVHNTSAFFREPPVKAMTHSKSFRDRQIASKAKSRT